MSHDPDLVDVWEHCGGAPILLGVNVAELTDVRELSKKYGLLA